MDKRYVRKYPRVSAEVAVELILDGKTYRARTAAVGGGGLSLSLEQHPPLELGSEVIVRFRPAKHLNVIEAKAKVCYVMVGGQAAVEFTEINAEDRRKLLQLIHHKKNHNRKHTRASLATQIKCEESMSLAFGRDISVGGMFIETTHPMDVGSRLTMRFNLSEREPILVATAEVTYQVGKLGVGIQFVDISPEDLKRIEVYVAKSKPGDELTG